MHPCIHVKIKGSLRAANTRSLNFLLHLPTYQPLIMRVTLRCSQVPSFKWPLFEATWPGIVSTQPSPCSTFLNDIIPRERVLHLTRRKLRKEASASVASRVTVVHSGTGESRELNDETSFSLDFYTTPLHCSLKRNCRLDFRGNDRYSGLFNELNVCSQR